MLVIAIAASILLTQLRDHAVTLGPAMKLPPAIAHASVIGLGEATHGSDEVARAKTFLFKRLVEDDGVRILAIEGDWSEWTAMDAYVTGGGGDAASLVAQQDFSLYRNAELAELVEWIHTYDRIHQDQPVHIIGIDMQEPARTKALAESGGPLAGAAAEQLRRASFRLAHPSLSARDADMYANILALVDSHVKIALWAHDGHVSTFDETNASWHPLGTLLRSALGKRYYAIGTLVGGGSFLARPAIGAPAVVMKLPDRNMPANEMFSQIAGPYFLDLRSVTPSSDLGKWLDEPRSFFMAGGTVIGGDVTLPLRLTRAFDAVVFLPDVHPSVPLAPKNSSTGTS